MAAIQEREPTRDLETHKRGTLDSLIAEQLLHALGRPRDLYKVQVRRVWENSYRVNVLIGVDAASIKVAHSYFLTADDDGKILKSTPKIARQY